MRIRDAAPEDFAEMHRVRLSVHENRLVRTVLTEKDYVDHLTVLGKGWVAEVDGVIRGLAIANRKNGSVWALFVEPGYEGLGIGRALQKTTDERSDGAMAPGGTRCRIRTFDFPYITRC